MTATEDQEFFKQSVQKAQQKREALQSAYCGFEEIVLKVSAICSEYISEFSEQKERPDGLDLALHIQKTIFEELNVLHLKVQLLEDDS